MPGYVTDYNVRFSAEFLENFQQLMLDCKNIYIPQAKLLKAELDRVCPPKKSAAAMFSPATAATADSKMKDDNNKKDEKKPFPPGSSMS